MNFEILETEQLEAGTTNDSPNTALRVRLEDGSEGWVAGPHGVDSCAVRDWLANVGDLAASKEDAIAVGCE